MTPTPFLPDAARWHVLSVKPRSEKKVETRLRGLGFQTYVPTQKQLRKWSDRKKFVEVVLFNNYVFVVIDEHRRNDVFKVGNVFRYLSFGGQIATLAEKEICTIQRLCSQDTPVEISYNRFMVGDEVEITGGTFRGLRGNVTSIRGNSKLQVSLPGLHCFAHVEIHGMELGKI